MEKEFVPYEQSLELKELGFDEGCFSLYFSNGEFSNFIHSFTVNSEVVEKTSSIPAPTFSQAFRWFREKYDLKGFVSPIEYLDGTDDTYHWCIYNKCNSGSDQLTYEKAELECLKKLIEIVKEK